MLREVGTDMLVDIRTVPRSRRVPHFIRISSPRDWSELASPTVTSLGLEDSVAARVRNP